MTATLPPLPRHPEPRTMKWSELERAAIASYGEACALAAIAAQAPAPVQPAPTVAPTDPLHEAVRSVSGQAGEAPEQFIEWLGKGGFAEMALCYFTREKGAAVQPVQPTPAASPTNDDLVLVPRDLLGAACSAIDRKRDAPTLLKKLRAITLSPVPAQVMQPVEAPAHHGMTIAGDGAAMLGALMREQYDSRRGVYPDGNPNSGVYPVAAPVAPAPVQPGCAELIEEFRAAVQARTLRPMDVNCIKRLAHARIDMELALSAIKLTLSPVQPQAEPVALDFIAAYADAIDDIESWANYASDYFQEKHGLAGVLKRHRDRLAAMKGTK